MSRDFRFDPPSVSELEEMARFEGDCDHNCETCWFDCGDEDL